MATDQVLAHAIKERMLARARSRILSSPEWITKHQLTDLGFTFPFPSTAASSIFTISHEGTDYFPRFALDLQLMRPLPAVKQVLEILSFEDPWHVAFWFDAGNTWLDGRRPQEVIGSEPEKVIVAARHEADRVSNG